MRIANTGKPIFSKPLRVWPGVAAVSLQWLLKFGVPVVFPESGMAGFLGPIALSLVVVLWWLFFSRAAWVERLGALVLAVAAVAVTPQILHKSVAGAGMGMLFYFQVIPVLCLAFVVWAVATRNLSNGVRRATMVAAILAGCGVFGLLRSGGISGDGVSDFAWRWSKTSEERLLAAAHDHEVGGASVAATETGVDWPGFRGPGRDSVIRGVRIETDWTASPPVELWRRPVGPGWSSFAAGGGLLYTQEQLGEDELVSCYRLSSGEPVWTHRDKARFWEANAGPGPRATPTLTGGRLYTFGATGILNALNAGDGSVVWSRDVAADTGAKVPVWGFASSPLVVGDTVFVAAAGQLAAYDLATGDPRWFGPARRGGYSSPQLATIGGVSQIVLLSGVGATGFAPKDGTPLWEAAWPGGAIVQPALTSEGDILISTSDMSGGIGIRRLAVARGADQWTVQERWTSNRFKPYFNDYVLKDGCAYGFDAAILACIDLRDGQRKWKGGRYGHGQLLLLSDQAVLLVLSEDGELALVRAAPDQFTELARFPAIEGKTWNHPALVGDTLLVRNGQEMAAFRLAPAD